MAQIVRAMVVTVTAVKVFPLVLVLLGYWGVSQVDSRVFDMDQDSSLTRAVRYIGRHPEILATKKIKDHLPTPYFMPDILCFGCMTFSSVVKTLIFIGVTWDDVRDEAVDICKVVVAVDGMNGDIFCPGVMDNNGPLFYEVFKKTKKSNKQICVHMNWCDPADMPSLYEDKSPGDGPQLTKEALFTTDSARIPQILKKKSFTGSEKTDSKNQVLLDFLKLFVRLQQGKTYLSEGRNVSEDVQQSDEQSPLSILQRQIKALSKKMAEAMKIVEMRDKLKPNAREMAKVIANALTRPSRRRRRRDALSTEGALRIAHITDIHVEEAYLTGAATDCGLPVCCRKDTPGEGYAGKWGDGNCNAPPRTLRLLIRSAGELNPDFVIYSGDNAPHILWLETLESQLNASRWVARELAAGFPSKRIYPNMGNHEMCPTNLYYTDREEIKTVNRKWGQFFKDSANFGPEQLATINKAGYYTILAKPGLRILAYNSNYGGIGNFYNILNYDRAEFKEMIAWMERTLASARTAGERVIITSHHQYGANENVVAFDEKITPIFAKYSDIIVWHPVGHVHRDEFRLIFDAVTGLPVGSVMVGQTMNTRPEVNPGFRIFYLHPKTFQLLDYDQYYIDIKDANGKAGEPFPAVKLYSARDEYDLTDLSPKSLYDLYKRMMANNTLLQRYWYNRRGRTGYDGECDAACRESQECHIVSATYDLYRECMRAKVTPSVFDFGGRVRAFQLGDGDLPSDGPSGLYSGQSPFLLLVAVVYSLACLKLLA